MKWSASLAPTRWSRPRTRTAAVVALIAAVACVTVIGVAKMEVRTGVDSFVPSDDGTAAMTDEVADAFGGDPVVVLLESESGEQLSSDNLPGLLELEGRLAEVDDVAAVYGPATVLNQIAAQAQRLLAELTGYRDGLASRARSAAEDDGLSEGDAAEAARQATDVFDERYGSLLVDEFPTGLPTLRNDKFVDNVVYNDAGDPRPQWHFVVPSDDAVAILVRPRQDLSQHAVETLVSEVRSIMDGSDSVADRVTVSGVPSVVAAMGSQVRYEVPVLGGIALASVGAWFLFTRWTRWRSRLLPLLTSLTGTGLTLAAFGWLSVPVSLGAVAFLPVLLAVGSDFMTYLHRRVGIRTVVAVAVATATSFAALAVTPIPVVSDLGLTLATGIVVSLLVSLVITWWLPQQAGAGPGFVGAGSRYGARRSGIGRRASWRVRAGAGVAAAAVALTGWGMLPDLPLKADFQGFAADLPVLEQARHVERVMGSSGEIGITLTGSDTVSRESLDWMREAESAVIAAHGDKVRPVLSPPILLDFLGTSPTASQLDAALRLVPRYLTTSVVRSDERMATMSFGVELHDAVQLRRLRDGVLDVLPPPPDGIDVELTGLPLVAVSGYEAIAGDRYLTSGLGIVAATGALGLILRRRVDALRAFAAAVLATGIMLLGMSVAGISLNPLTAAIGSLIAAVACSFTVVLSDAARRDDRWTRGAVLVAAPASALGYAALLFSRLSVVRELGVLLCITVLVAVLSAWFVVWMTFDTHAHDGGATGTETEPMKESEQVGATP
ncbi:hypothetical protein SAMN06265360_12243 [Haloechinothrix alba]|uniref:Membrane transport protein MMPL domain-containing protein n=1 Tax=Haloechinothrix alba TaxID=664784 RepID=A0A238ZLW6_9PSEU|nr:hypothetical protein [Haloechinothrix alba]SNR84109.1 hypothetical protein SAMN06265360_12243 [Haloechinothrix alba]